jgi:hypothetical protein
MVLRRGLFPIKNEKGRSPGQTAPEHNQGEKNKGATGADLL